MTNNLKEKHTRTYKWINIMIIIIICVLAILIPILNRGEDVTKTIKKLAKVDVSNCEIVQGKDTHSDFLGDGEKLVVYDCSQEDILPQIKNWKTLPLSENLNLMMYGGEKEGVTYLYNLASENNIPYIEEGYYYFLNENPESISINGDKNLFNAHSFNFTIMLYDLSTNFIYYFKYDT